MSATCPSEAASARGATLADIRKHGHVITPGRYVGVKPQEDDGVSFKEKMSRFTAWRRKQRAKARQLEKVIKASLSRNGV